MPWSPNIVVESNYQMPKYCTTAKWIVGLTCTFVALSPVFATPTPEEIAANLSSGKSAGSTSGALAIGAYGSKDAIKNNITVPMTGGGAMLRTLDGQTSFSGTMSAPASGQFLEILIQPAATGDLSLVTVGQDTDANGTLDYSFNLGMPVSGVCANGFFSCTPGTWNGCHPYGWKSAGGLKVTFGAVPMTSLGGCYCINSSCGSNLVWSNSGIVLKDLGGGIVAAIQSSDASAMVTDVQSDPVSIRYFGRVVSGTNASTPAATATVPSAPQDVQGYYSAPSIISTASSDLPLSQGSNPNSLYYQVTNSSAFAGASERRNCTIRKEGVMSTVTDASFTDSGTGSICTDHLVYMRIKKDGNNYDLQLVDTGPSGLGSMHHNCNDDPGGDRWHNFKSFSLPADTANLQSGITKAVFSVTNINGSGCSPNGQMAMDGVISGFNTPVVGTAPCPSSGAQTPTFNWSYLFEFATDTYSETVSDSCAAIEADPTCRLRNEVVDSFTTTIQNFNRTNLRPVSNCKNFTGALGVFEKCHEWWEKRREYVCDGTTSWSLSDTTQRFTSVVSTTGESGNVINFSDARQGENGWTSVPMTISLPAADNFSECEKACKVKRPRLDTQIAISGVPSAGRNDQTTYDFYYFACPDEVTCPAEPGDTIVTACSCLNDFGQAASVMQMMRMGGGDSICSDGVAKQN